MKSARRRMLAVLLVMPLVLAFSSMASAGLITDGSYYIGDATGKLHSVNTSTGVTTLIGNTGLGSSLWDIAFDSTGLLWGITSSTIYKIDATTAVTTFVGNHGLGGEAFALDFNSADVLYAAVRGNQNLYTISTGTGAGSLVGSIGAAVNGDLAFDASDNLYMSGNDEKLYSVNTSTGAGTVIGSGMGYSQIAGMDFVGGTLIGISRTTDDMISINTSTGVGTYIAKISPNSISTYGASSAPLARSVPEPATLGLLGLGLIGLGFRVRRRR